MQEEYDRERWRGSVDARLNNIEGDVSSVHTKYDGLDVRLRLTDLSVAKITTKLAMWAAGGAILGGGVVTAILKLVFK